MSQILISNSWAHNPDSQKDDHTENLGFASNAPMRKSGRRAPVRERKNFVCSTWLRKSAESGMHWEAPVLDVTDSC
jgi:hypothetical protein